MDARGYTKKRVGWMKENVYFSLCLSKNKRHKNILEVGAAMSPQDVLQDGLGVVLLGIQGEDRRGGTPVGFLVNLGAAGKAGLEVLFEEEIGLAVVQGQLQNHRLALGLDQFKAVRQVAFLVSAVGIGELVNQTSHLVAVQPDGVSQVAVVKKETAAATSRGVGLVRISVGRGSRSERTLGRLYVAVGEPQEARGRLFVLGESVVCRQKCRIFFLLHFDAKILSRVHVDWTGCDQTLKDFGFTLIFLYLFFQNNRHLEGVDILDGSIKSAVWDFQSSVDAKPGSEPHALRHFHTRRGCSFRCRQPPPTNPHLSLQHSGKIDAASHNV